jgi:hypothetical protein
MIVCHILKKPKRTIKSYGSWSLMSLITGNKVKKKPHKPRYCEKEKDKANKRILRSLSFDNNGLVKPSCDVLDETYKFNLQSSIFNKIYNFLIDQYKYN